MLKSDVDELDALIDPSLLFIGPTGALATKEDDLANHRSGAQKIAKIAPRDLVIELHGSDIAAVTSLVDLEVVFNGKTFAGPFRYLRTWRRNEDGAWRIIAGAVTPVATPN
jgi:hypothetical protein